MKKVAYMLWVELIYKALCIAREQIDDVHRRMDVPVIMSELRSGSKYGPLGQNSYANFKGAYGGSAVLCTSSCCQIFAGMFMTFRE